MGLNEVPVVCGGDFASELPGVWPREQHESSGALRGLRSVLVPLDGSPFAEHALPQALAIARRSGATVRLVHVHSLLDSVKLWQQYYSDDLIELMRRKKQAYLQSVLRRISRLVDEPVAAMVIESGDITRSLCEAAAGASLVVMATHARGLVGRLINRSRSRLLIRQLPCPSILVHGGDSAADLTGDPMPRRVLIPLDGSRRAEQIIDWAGAIGGLAGAHFTLAHFCDLEQIDPGLHDPHGYLIGAARRFQKRLRRIHTEVVVSDQRTAPAILALADDLEFDLIALTTHGESGVARLLKRSVADAVIRRATTPVLVYRHDLGERVWK